MNYNENMNKQVKILNENVSKQSQNFPSLSRDLSLAKVKASK